MGQAERAGTLETVLADVRYALRGLRRSPGFALTAILTLALGIGTTSAVLGAVNAVLLSPLPYPESERLVRVFQQNSPTNRWTISNADWQGIKEQQRTFSSVALVRSGGAALSTQGQAEWVRLGWATSGFFPTLGVTLARGRGFQEGDDTPGRQPGVVVSEDFWVRHFGTDDPIGRAILLDGTSYTVVGTLSGGMQQHAGVRAEVWPILQLPTPTRRGPFGYAAIGRLKPGVTIEAATRDLAAISERIYPLWASGFKDRTARLTPYSLRDVIVGDASKSLGILLAAVALVLVIAIANVANLVLVRSTSRAREMAVRTALGAPRMRIARQLLTESLVLGSLGGVLGLGVAWLGLKALTVLGPNLPRMGEARLDPLVVSFTLGIALLSGVLVGIYPLVYSMTRSLATSMRSGDRGAGTSRGTRIVQGTLVAAEFALALPLLLGAGLLLQSLLNLQRVNPGFDPRGLLTARVSLPAASYGDSAAIRRFWNDALRSTGEIPGVVNVGLASVLPPDSFGETNNFDLMDKPVEPGSAEPVAPWSWVTPRLFAALGVPLVEGRYFEETDNFSAPPVVIVSRAWADRYYPGASAIGKRLYPGGCRECEPSTVVGVVGNVKHEGLTGGGDAVYEPTLRDQRELNLVIRTAGDPSSIVGPLRDRIRTLDPGVPIRDLATMENRLSDAVANPKRLAWILGAFATAAVTLAALGVFGVLSYIVAQQRKEIGVRIALGADRAAIVGMVLRRGMLRTVIGLAAGILISVQGKRVLDAVLFEVSATDWTVFAWTSLLLLGVAFLACWLPGRKAASIEPVEALRYD